MPSAHDAAQAAAEAALAETEKKVCCRGLSSHLQLTLSSQTVALGQKMDLVFAAMQLHFMFGDYGSIQQDIRKVRPLVCCASAVSKAQLSSCAAERAAGHAGRQRLGAQEPAEGVRGRVRNDNS